MKAIQDNAIWMKAWLETPIYPPPNPASREAAMRTPGCFVKSIETKSDNEHQPRYFGRVSMFDAENDRVVVISAPIHDLLGHPRTVWIGTVDQYLSFFRCD